MQDASGKHRTLGEYKNKKAIAVVFVGTECPIANLYFPTLAEMQKRYANKGVQFLAINSNDQDSLAAVVAHARSASCRFRCSRTPSNGRPRRSGLAALRRLFCWMEAGRSTTMDGSMINTATCIGGRLRLGRN